MSSSGWQEINIGDVVDTISQKHKFDKDKIILVNTSDVLEGKVLNHEYVPNKNLKGQFKKSFQKYDILYSEIRPQNKRFAYVDFDSEDYVASTKLMVLRKKNNKITSDFLYQVLKSDDIINKLQVIAESRSGTFPQITFAELSRLSILIPPLQEQKAIAATLSCLDDKIELNNRINKNLEEIAQAIFKSWFVDFEPFQDGEFEESELGRIPKGWRVFSLGDVTNDANTGGDAIQKTPIVDYDTGAKCVRVGDMANRRCIEGWGFCKVNEENFKKYQLRKNDIIVTRTATLGLNQIIDEDHNAVYNNGLIRLKLKAEVEPLFIFQAINTSNYYEYIGRIESESSTRPNMKINYLLKYQFICPPLETQKEFSLIINPLRKQRTEINKQIRKLTDIRDTLLPKLMSGEIRVPAEEVD